MEHKGGSLRVVLVLMAVLWLVAGPGATPGSADSLWEWLYWILCSPIPPGEARPDEYYAAMCKGALKEYEQEKTALTGPQLLSVVGTTTRQSRRPGTRRGERETQWPNWSPPRSRS